MPRDIRSYFPSVKTNFSTPSVKTAKRRVISSDEDESKQSPVKRSKKIKVKSISSDSDEDVSKQKKLVSPAEIFGKKPISRQEAPKITKQLRKKEAKGHNDDDFEATLSQLDTSDIEKKYLEEKPATDFNIYEEDGNEEKKKTPPNIEYKTKGKKTPEKTNTEQDDEKHEQPNKKLSTSSSNKNAKKTFKIKTSISKIEVQHKEPKKKSSPKKAELVDEYEKRIEKKKQHSAMYQHYLQRGGAKNPGSKEIPVGADYCLAGLSFLITGVLVSLEREEVEELIQKYGGRLLHQVSKKTDYVIIGDQPGPAKISKANSLGTKQISENDLLEMIRTRPAAQASNVKQSHTKSSDRGKRKSIESKHASPSPSKKLKGNENEEADKSENIHSPCTKVDTEKNAEKPLKQSPCKIKHDDRDATGTTEIKSPNIKKEMNEIKDVETKTDTLHDINGNIPIVALVEKYRPKNMKQILGQQGDKSNVKKLHMWLQNWHNNQSGQVKHAKPSSWAKNDDGSFFKAALLSGPPGIGKTTTVQVVCNELGFDLLEFNASDTRSKRLLQEQVSKILSNTTLKDYFIDSKNKPTSKHALLMDEVDGMAGNEDRGGLQELINLIKSTDIPIICICNDRNNPKMRTLANYIFDLRFPKPRLEQIRGAMKSICFKENIDISTEDLDRLIESTNQDIRQIINHLALFIGKSGSQEQSKKKHANKDLKLGPWDVVRKVFSAEEHKSMSIHDKSDLFFHDYSIAPLFVQENYLLVVPHGPKEKLLETVAECSESLALGDMVEKSIRSNGAWSLLPMQACYSSVIPGTVMSGHIGGQINFPSWLGRNSKAGKFDRLMQEITVHARLATGSSKEAINLDYIKPLRDAIIRPLAFGGAEGVDTAINVMNRYHLLRDDLDALIEISLWPDIRDPMQSVDSKVKAAFTRAYNKHSAVVPYTVGGATSKKKAAQNSQDEGLLDEEEEDANSDDNVDNVETDKMIKAKKPTTSKKVEPKGKNTNKTETKGKSSDKTTSKRGRGRGKAK